MANKKVERNFDFSTYWDADSSFLYEAANTFVDALVTTGKCSEAEAVQLVSDFQRESFSHGSSDEAFNNCGEDA